MSSCLPYNVACNVRLTDVMNITERSAADRTDMTAARTLYAFENKNFVSKGIQPTFKSHADYLRYKKAQAELNSTKYKS